MRLAADAQLSRIEDAGLNASAPPQQRWLDGWLVRTSPGSAKRARCINAVAEGRLPLAERMALAQAVYAEAGLPMILRITPFTAPVDLEGRVAAMGWRHFDDTRVMVWPDFVAAPGGPEPRPLTADAYAAAIGRLRGASQAQCLAHAQRLKASPVPYQGFAIDDGGELLACGQFAREGDLVGLYDVFTAPAARRRGLASGLCGWLLQRAASAGARHAYLQVDAGNAAARSVYRRMGFRDAYGYHYRTPETGPV